MKNNKTMQAAKANKNDEFYTRLQTIEDEISMHMDYVRQFYGKTVLCNCDDPEWSNFFLFFRNHFEQLRLKKVIFTHYEPEGKPSYKLEWDGSYLGYDTLNLIKTPLEGNGDFRSPECVALLDECDIVVTNPPFSLLREFIKLIIDHKKDMVIIGNMNVSMTKEIFPLMKEGKLFFGYGFNLSMIFKTPYTNNLEANQKFVRSKGLDPNEGYLKVPGVAWFTTLKLDKYNDELPLTAQYEGHESEYPYYSNCDAIEVNYVGRIPRDYFGVMGVFGPSFLANYNDEQFEIVGMVTSETAEDLGVDRIGEEWVKRYRENGGTGHITANMRNLVLYEKGKAKMPNSRILIRRKNNENHK